MAIKKDIKALRVSGIATPAAVLPKDGRELMLLYLDCLCSVESHRFGEYMASVLSAGDPRPAAATAAVDGSRSLLPGYFLAQWANGTVDREIVAGREPGAAEALIRWARYMIELNTIFASAGVADPVGTLTERGLVFKDGHGYDFNKKALASLLETPLTELQKLPKGLFV